MANSLLTPTVIAKEMLMEFKNQLGMGNDVNRQYDDQFAKKGAKIGSSITIRKPNRYAVQTGATLVNQDVTEESSILTLDKQKHVAIKFTSADMALTIDDFKNRYITSAVSALANQVDIDLHALYKDVPNLVGSAGTTPATALVWLQGGQKLDEFGAPMDGKRCTSLNPAAQAATVDGLKGLFQSSEKISSQYEKGRMGQGLGFNFRMSQNVASHTVGPLGGTPLVNGASQTGATLVTDGWTASAASRLKQGDVFTIANVFAVNPISKISTGALQQFVVTADVSSDGSGNLTAAISPSIVTSGALQTVSGSPADNAAVTVVGTAATAYPQNLAFHRDAFVLGCADLELPSGVDFAAVASDAEAGLSLRIVRAYDISADTFPCRIDILYGLKTVRPEWACRVVG
jgi:hypothetical protein